MSFLLHQDHFDKTAFEYLPKSLPIYCQPSNEDQFLSEGFQSVLRVDEKRILNNVEIIRTDGQHGSGKIRKTMGKVSGFVLQAENEPTLYWAGDTIWCDEVIDVLENYHPDFIIVHGCGAKLQNSNVIIMDDEMVTIVCQHAPDAVIIAVHMESLDHATVTRAQLRQSTTQKGISNDQLLIPVDGQILEFNLS